MSCNSTYIGRSQRRIFPRSQKELGACGIAARICPVRYRHRPIYRGAFIPLRVHIPAPYDTDRNFAYGLVYLDRTCKRDTDKDEANEGILPRRFCRIRLYALYHNAS